MTIPAGIATVTITSVGGIRSPDGSPAVGTVDFIASPERVLYVGPKVVTVPVKVTATLVDASYPAGFKLPAVDDTAANPSGWTYRVVERFKGGSTYSISLLAANGATQDITTLMPVSSSLGTAVVVGPRGPAGASLIESPPGSGLFQIGA